MAIIEDELNLTDLVNVDTLQKMQDAFSLMTGIASLTTDRNGIAVTKPSNFSEFCTKYARATEEGRKRCEQCDKIGAEMAKKAGTSCAYVCYAGLVDFAAPIIAGGRMVGCLIGGQVLTEPYNEEKKRKVALEIGVDPEQFVEAARRVQIVDKEVIKRATKALYTIANILSDIALNEHQIYLKNLELKKASHMKSDFLANMSHEIRTPMNAVIGMAEMALREELPPAAREYVSQIKSSGQTLLTIINDILDFSKIESGKMDISNVEYEPMSLINDMVNIIMTRIGNKKLEFTIDVNPNLPHELYGDNIRIKQVLVNLTNNAVKFTKEGRVHLKVDFWETEEDTIELQMSVSDTGSGIKERDMKRLFKSFQQLDSKRNRNIEGTGLGLAISKQLVSLMNGKIHVDSVYGEGSTFSFVIPQKVINKSPTIHKLSEKLSVAGLVENPYLADEMKVDMERFELDYIRIDSEEELDQLPERNVKYLFIEGPMFTEVVQDFMREHSDIVGVVLVNFRSMRSYNIPNVRVIKKPLYALNLASILRGEDVFTSQTEADDFDFTAPEAEILVVDDNVINLTVAQGLLKPLDMRIDTALSGKEAVAKVTDKRYDIIFMDHMMPEMDGVETTRVIRRLLGENGQVPIIALTANAMEGTREMFVSEEMNDFVAKPIELKIMISKLRKWLPKEKIIRRKNVEKNGTQIAASKEESSDWVEKLSHAGLDVKAAIKLLGNEKLYGSVLKEYYRVIDKKYALIQKYEQEEKWKEYTIEVHALKSASRQIGAQELALAAEQMEAAGNAQDAELIHKMTSEMLKQYLQCKNILTPYFTEEKKENGEKQAKKEDLIELFGQMRDAMDNLDMDAMEEVMQNMQQYSYEKKQEDYFKELKSAVEDIDTERGEEILKKWEKELNDIRE